MPIRALVFDFDGLVVETEEPRLVAWQEIWAEHGVTLAAEDLAADIGTTGALDPLAMLEARLGRTLDPSVRVRKQVRHDELLSATVAMPGVEQYVADSRRLGLKIAVASSSPRSWIDEHLARLGLADAFALVCCFDDVGVAKPDPAVYVAACHLLGVATSEALALEDSVNGVRAAKTAGLTCVAVPTPMTKHMAFDEADAVIESLADVPLEELLDRLA